MTGKTPPPPTPQPPPMSAKGKSPLDLSGLKTPDKSKLLQTVPGSKPEENVVHGATIECTTTPQDDYIQLTRGCLYPKEKRETMTDTDKTALFETIIAKNKGHARYKQMSMQLDDSDTTLKETVDLHQQIRLTREHLERYDCADVFHIVFPVDLNSGPQLHAGSVYLFDDYSSVTTQQVAISCAWYRRYPNASKQPGSARTSACPSRCSKLTRISAFSTRLMKSLETMTICSTGDHFTSRSSWTS